MAGCVFFFFCKGALQELSGDRMETGEEGPGWSHWVFVGALLRHRGNHFRCAWVTGFCVGRPDWLKWEGDMPGPGRFSFSMNRPLIQIVELAFAVERNMRTHLFKVTWRHCFGCFCGDQNRLFLWEVRPSPSVTVATKTDFSSRPNRVFFFTGVFCA